jgi:nitrite reductase/ring-hydroxylating ferredoxin subunit
MTTTVPDAAEPVRAHTLTAEDVDGRGVEEVSVGIRDSIPALGLTEYWYPVVPLRKVPRRKPLGQRILGQDLVLFRTPEGAGATSAWCPHRGADLSRGRCHFAGTVTCPYHGWTFDAEGECRAVLAEGPTSRIPGQRTATVRSYPTRVLKGMVFVWMGEGAPVPIEEDVPPEFFKPEALVLSSTATWKCNWRPAMENYLDAHVFYVHRNSLRLLTMPAARLVGLARSGSMRKERPQILHSRAILRPRDIGPVGERVDDSTPAEQPPNPFAKGVQESYPGLGGARWPRTNGRYHLSCLVAALRSKRPRPPLETDEEWTLIHLPSTVRTDNSKYLYTRTMVPVDADRSKAVYFHTRYPRGSLSRILYRVLFRAWYDWYYNTNFSGQDARIVNHQRYDLKEKLSHTDTLPIAWRKLAARHARRAPSEEAGR